MKDLPMTTSADVSRDQPTLFGHPTGLFTLFFAEMWERFSYYGMRALLMFYMIKGFLGLNDHQSYEIYGIYAALVYATPFIGGMLADRLLGERRAVVIGGCCFAAGHLLLTVEHEYAFFTALALLIVGNGFFKPNISTMVGSLYPEGSKLKSGGFTLFYMGINLGAAMSPLLCGYVGETYGWHYGFGLAAIGMVIGLAVFVAPIRITQLLIGLGALCTSVGLIYLPDNGYLLAVNLFVVAALLSAAAVAIVALQRGGLPPNVGCPPSKEKLNRKSKVGISYKWLVYLGVAVAVPLISLLMSHSNLTVPLPAFLNMGPSFTIELAGTILAVFGGAAFIYLIVEALRSTRIERHRLFVVLILLFFSMLFYAFFEQAGSSINNFTDRNVDRVIGGETVKAEQIGQTVAVTVNQKQVGYDLNGKPFSLDQLDQWRASHKGADQKMDWTLTDAHRDMVIGGNEIPASTYQSANPIFILIFGLMFTALWGFLAKHGKEPSTTVKFSFGLILVGLGFGALWYGARCADGRGMVWMGWLLLGYMLQTMGELCLSPVGLSMVTSLSPKRMVATVMGAWFLASAFSNYLSSIIAKLTGVTVEEGADQVIPPPTETLSLYADVFLKIAIAAMISGAFLMCLAPLLNRWMHPGEDAGSGEQQDDPQVKSGDPQEA